MISWCPRCDSLGLVRDTHDQNDSACLICGFVLYAQMLPVEPLDDEQAIRLKYHEKVQEQIEMLISQCALPGTIMDRVGLTVTEYRYHIRALRKRWGLTSRGRPPHRQSATQQLRDAICSVA